MRKSEEIHFYFPIKQNIKAEKEVGFMYLRAEELERHSDPDLTVGTTDIMGQTMLYGSSEVRTKVLILAAFMSFIY